MVEYSKYDRDIYPLDRFHTRGFQNDMSEMLEIPSHISASKFTLCWEGVDDYPLPDKIDSLIDNLCATIGSSSGETPSGVYYIRSEQTLIVYQQIEGHDGITDVYLKKVHDKLNHDEKWRNGNDEFRYLMYQCVSSSFGSSIGALVTGDDMLKCLLIASIGGAANLLASRLIMFFTLRPMNGRKRNSTTQKIILATECVLWNVALRYAPFSANLIGYNNEENSNKFQFITFVGGSVLFLAMALLTLSFECYMDSGHKCRSSDASPKEGYESCGV